MHLPVNAQIKIGVLVPCMHVKILYEQTRPLQVVVPYALGRISGSCEACVDLILSRRNYNST
jgi:hypothetical protein